MRSSSERSEVAVYDEEDLLPLSGLQHLLFCERQAALIHVEQLWRDNPLTLEGSHLHKRVDEDAPRREVRKDLVILRGLGLRSLRLGLVGRADVVELRRPEAGHGRNEASATAAAVPITGLKGIWTPFPVEYKRGKPKPDRCDEVQLCAQALCIEEMLSVEVASGALFYGRRQQRTAVAFDAELREVTVDAARRYHELFTRRETPRVPPEPKCKQCSLVEICLPEATGKQRSALRYLDAAFSELSSAANGG